MEKRHGTIENYFVEALGIDTSGQKALRELLLATIEEFSQRHKSEHVWLDTLKIISDGVTENHKAYCFEPYWKNTDRTYQIQWALKDDAAVLWAYDPDAGRAVEVLQIRKK